MNPIHSSKVHNTWLMLRITYAVVPILIGLDKCLGWWLVNWAIYASPFIMHYIPVSVTTFTVITGIIEIIAGIIVWFRPRFGGYLLVAWLGLVIINLLSMNNFYDIIARDVVIAIGALALAWLSEA